MSIRTRRLMRVCVPVYLVLVAGSATVRSQQAPPAAPDVLTSESVREQLKRITDDVSIEEALKTRLTELYTQAVDDLLRSEDWSKRADEFDTARQEAPARLAAIRAELATPVVDAAPQVPADASVDHLSQLLARDEADLKAARDTATGLDEERKRRADRRTALPGATTAARQKLEEAARAVDTATDETEPPSVQTAKKIAARARRQALEQELRCCEAELASYDARGELLTARRDKAARDVARLESVVKAWQAILGERRRVEAAAAAQAAQEARRAASRSHPIAREIAEENATWAERRAADDLANKIERAADAHESIAKTLGKVTSDYASITLKVKAAGLTRAMGLLLRRQRELLPPMRDHLRRIAVREAEISRVQVELIELEDVRSNLVTDLDSLVRAAMDDPTQPVAPEERTELETVVRELLTARRGYLDALIGDYNSYLIRLVDLDNEERHLVQEIDRFRDYIDKRVLWVRSTSFPRMNDLRLSVEALGWLFEPKNWLDAAYSAGRTMRSRPEITGLALIVLLVLVRLQRRLRGALRRFGEMALKPSSRDFQPTVLTLVYTLLVAAPWPTLLAVIGWSLASGQGNTDFAKAIGAAFGASALAFMLIESFRQVARIDGLGEAHFDWSTKSLRLARRNLTWLLTLGVPLAFLVVAIDNSGEVPWHNSLGRFAFIVGQLVVAVFTAKVLHPQRGVLKEFLKRYPSGWLGRLRYAWYPLSIALPLALAALATAGFHYTAIELAIGVHTTVWFIFGLLVVNGMASRWLLISRRRLAIARIRKRSEAAAAEGGPRVGEASHQPADLVSISAQTRSLLRTAVVLGFFGGMWLIWAGMLPALGILDNVTLWSVTERVSETVTGTDGATSLRWVERPQAITLQDLTLGLLLFLVTFVAAKNFPGFLEITVLQRLPVKAGERYAIATIAKYSITVAGMAAAFGAIGIGWAKVQWLAAAMVVGLGFGLQEIFANFVSGLILLFERPIRIGDTVTTGEVTGEVTRIQIRATTVTDWDRKELVIPNKEFVTGRVINWTLSDSTLRVVIPVGIAYGSDTALAEKLMLETALACELVMKEPAPHIYFVGFGASSLDFELRVFVQSVDRLMPARHHLHKRIDSEFRKANIEIAFPQRDIHVRSIKGAWPMVDRQAGGDTTPPIPEG